MNIIKGGKIDGFVRNENGHIVPNDNPAKEELRNMKALVTTDTYILASIDTISSMLVCSKVNNIVFVCEQPNKLETNL
ncbi:MAG: hypothetical protein VX100_20900 [Pseudomonadota bacterium]|nr:hypothetical protein [Pseudomonadota bacterium]